LPEEDVDGQESMSTKFKGHFKDFQKIFGKNIGFGENPFL